MVNRKLNLIASITPGYTINTIDCNLVYHDSYGTALQRRYKGDTRELVYEFIIATITETFNNIGPNLEILKLLEKCIKGIENLKETYHSDEDLKLKLQLCIDYINFGVGQLTKFLKEMSNQLEFKQKKIAQEFSELVAICNEKIAKGHVLS